MNFFGARNLIKSSKWKFKEPLKNHNAAKIIRFYLTRGADWGLTKVSSSYTGTKRRARRKEGQKGFSRVFIVLPKVGSWEGHVEHGRHGCFLRGLHSTYYTNISLTQRLHLSNIHMHLQHATFTNCFGDLWKQH